MFYFLIFYNKSEYNFHLQLHILLCKWKSLRLYLMWDILHHCLDFQDLVMFSLKMFTGIFYLCVYLNRFRSNGEAIEFGNTALIIFIWGSTWELFQRPMMQLGEWSTSENFRKVT